MNRRDFIKKSALVTGVGAIASVSILKTAPSITNTRSLFSKEYDTIDDVVKISKDYKRFEQKNTAFNLGMWCIPNNWTKSYAEKGEVENWKFVDYPTNEDTQDPHVVETMPGALARVLGRSKIMPDDVRKKAGYTQIDLAFAEGARATEKLTGSIFSRAFSGDSGPFATALLPNGNTMPMTLSLFKHNYPGLDINPNKYSFDSKDQATYAVKKVAKVFGASLVGIAPYDDRWTYKSEVFFPFNAMTNVMDAERFNLEREVDFGFEPKSVIVIIHEVDYEGIKTSPGISASAANSVQYSAMMEVGLKMTAYLRGLGYGAQHAGNDKGLSVPLAISAGLGESSRMGLLITEEFGPRVRISKIYTDLELTTDKPKTFGVKKFCEVCKKCADNCPSGAITTINKTTDPENVWLNRSNNKGVDKWYLDSHKCLTFWSDNWSGCCNCMTVCPYNKIDVWHHDIAEIATKLPLLRNVARYLDEIFGYGIVGSEEYMYDYWRKGI